jgi:hypothetical protein
MYSTEQSLQYIIRSRVYIVVYQAESTLSYTKQSSYCFVTSRIYILLYQAQSTLCYTIITGKEIL